MVLPAVEDFVAGERAVTTHLLATVKRGRAVSEYALLALGALACMYGCMLSCEIMPINSQDLTFLN